MSLDNFIPTLWSTDLLMALEKAHVFGQSNVVNKNYEGEITKAGDSVKINAIGEITIFNYDKNTNMPAPQELSGAQTTLLIDQSKGFNFQVDDIDKAQMNQDVRTAAMRRAGYGLRNVADRFIASLMVASAGSTIGTTAAPESLSAASEAYEYIVDLGTRLHEKNVPEEGRYLIVPPWYHGQLLKDDRFVKAPLSSPNTNVILNGQVAFVSGFTVLVSNNVVHEGGGESVIGQYSQVVAGHEMATTYADQIVQVEAFRPEARFANAVKGLHVYGSKVIRPEALAVLTVDRPAGS